MATAARPAVKSYSQLFIGGRWVAPSSDSVIEVISPVTEEVIATVPEAQPADVDAAVAAARRAFDEGPWPRMAPAERAAALLRIRARGRAALRRDGGLRSRPRSAPRSPSAARSTRTRWRCGPTPRTLHERFAFEETRTWADGSARIVREPVGVVATIIPWNGPVATASLKLGPALAAGCTVVLKPAPEGPVSAMLLAEAIEAAGLPEGVVSVLPAGTRGRRAPRPPPGRRQGRVHRQHGRRPADHEPVRRADRARDARARRQVGRDHRRRHRARRGPADDRRSAASATPARCAPR